jgi:hypothetical protein
MPTELIVNLSDAKDKRMLLEMLRALEGPHRVQWCKHRKRRTDRQNRMYWPLVVQPFADFLREQGESYTDDDAHELLKAKFLRVSVANKDTGEVIGEIPRSTTTLTTEEFYDYVEKCVAWLADMFGIECPSPDPYRQAELRETA